MREASRRGGAPGGVRWARLLSFEHPFPWLAPITAMLLVFGTYPLLNAAWLSLHVRNRIGRVDGFAWLKNWTTALTDDRVWNALQVTFTYTAIALAVQLSVGLAMAMLLDQYHRGFGVMRAVVTLPLVVPSAGRIAIPARPGVARGPTLVLGVRPEDRGVGPDGGIAATVTAVEPTGPEKHLYCGAGGQELCAISRSRIETAPGQAVTLRPDPDRSHLFDPKTGLALSG
ncbi:MAG: TOBE domain-containing protein [Paracoccaceae bacterium]